MDNCVELEALSRDECLRLLGKATVGRIGLSRDALPTVIPVNYCVKDDRIFVHVGSRDPLAAMLNRQVVAFEVDEIDPMSHIGWTVVVTGRAAVVTDRADLEDVKLGPVPQWTPLGDGQVMSITTELIAGRRLPERG